MIRVRLTDGQRQELRPPLYSPHPSLSLRPAFTVLPPEEKNLFSRLKSSSLGTSYRLSASAGYTDA